MATITLAAIHEEASDAAVTAAQVMADKYGQDWGACGFAWVEVAGVKLNTKLGKGFKALGFTKSYVGKTIQLWNPSNFSTQNIDIKEAGANAYASVLKKYGFSAWCGSRLD